jgi:hypothetical protein
VFCIRIRIQFGQWNPNPDPGSTKRPKKAKTFDEALRMISLEASAGDSILIKKTISNGNRFIFFFKTLAPVDSAT